MTTGDRQAGAESTTGVSVVTSGLWNGLSYVLPQLYTLVISVVAARMLRPEGMGRQSYIAFVEISTVTLLTSGFSLGLRRYIGESVGRRRVEVIRRLIAWAWRVCLVIALLGAGGLLVGAAAQPELSSAWMFAALGCAFGILHSVPAAVLTGLQEWRKASVISLVTGALGTVATVAVLAAGGGIPGMFAVEAAIIGANLLWTAAVARPVLAAAAPTAADAGDLPRQVTRYALTFSVSMVLEFVVWKRTEFFFLQRYSTNTEIALYSVSFAMVTALGRVAEAGGAVMSSALATLHGAEAVERIRRGFGRALRLAMAAALPMTAGFLAVGPTLLRAVYGDDYRGAGPVVRIMVLTFPLVLAYNLSVALMVGQRRLRAPIVIAAVAAAVNLTLDFVLIPGHGSVGAALANGGGQLAAGTALLAYARWSVGGLDLAPSVVARIVAASLAVGLTGWATLQVMGGPPGLVLAVAAGLVAFLVAGKVLRILDPGDAAWLDRSYGARLGGRVGRLVRALASPVS